VYRYSRFNVIVHTEFQYTDSGILGIDNRCTACISPYLEDFETAPDEITAAIKGFGGSKFHGAHRGKIVWRFADDLGAVHTFRIPNSYYVPLAEYRLLSPQHWARAYSRKREKMGCDTNGVRFVLYWPDTLRQRHTITISHGRHDNVATFRLADGYKSFESFCTEVGECFEADNGPLILPSEVVSEEKDEFDDAEYSDLPSTDQLSPDEVLKLRIIGPSTGTAVKHSTDPNTEPTRIELTTTEFDLDRLFGPQDIIEEEEDRIPHNHFDEVLRLHYNTTICQYRTYSKWRSKECCRRDLRNTQHRSHGEVRQQRTTNHLNYRSDLDKSYRLNS
jgi:hypothetical protein